jgi:hypothetical protein
VQTIYCCIEQRELGHGDEKNKSTRDTDITAPQPEKVGQSPKSEAKSKNRHLPRVGRPSTTICPNPWQYRALETRKKVF